MMTTEQQIFDMLSKSEQEVFKHIVKECQEGNGSIKESMGKMGERLGLSEATVHRAVRKLRKQGVIGVVPSMEKAESNEIVYYGIPDPEQQAHDIFKMIGELSSSANRFEMILKAKEQQVEKLIRDKELLYERINELENENRQLQATKSGFDTSNIISSQPLDDGTIAYIIKTT